MVKKYQRTKNERYETSNSNLSVEKDKKTKK
jgi:hypothetical protein